MELGTSGIVLGALLAVAFTALAAAGQAYVTYWLERTAQQRAARQRVLGGLRDNLGPLRRRAEELAGGRDPDDEDWYTRTAQIVSYLALVRDLAAYQACDAAYARAWDLRWGDATDLDRLTAARAAAREAYLAALVAIGNAERRIS
jgi:hypothetical protein